MDYALKQINKSYNKRFTRLSKNILITPNVGGILFVEYLKYLRDLFTITQKPMDAISTINAAIEEFEEYQRSKKVFHWHSFCEFIKLNAYCNSAIEFHEKTLNYITTDSIVKSINDDICQIRDIKYKIKRELNSLYGKLCVEKSNMIVIDTIPES